MNPETGPKHPWRVKVRRGKAPRGPGKFPGGGASWLPRGPQNVAGPRANFEGEKRGAEGRGPPGTTFRGAVGLFPSAQISKGGAGGHGRGWPGRGKNGIGARHTFGPAAGREKNPGQKKKSRGAGGALGDVAVVGGGGPGGRGGGGGGGGGGRGAFRAGGSGEKNGHFPTGAARALDVPVAKDFPDTPEPWATGGLWEGFPKGPFFKPGCRSLSSVIFRGRRAWVGRQRDDFLKKPGVRSGQGAMRMRPKGPDKMRSVTTGRQGLRIRGSRRQRFRGLQILSTFGDSPNPAKHQ